MTESLDTDSLSEGKGQSAPSDDLSTRRSGVQRSTRPKEEPPGNYWAMTPRLLRAGEVATYLGVSRSQVYALMAGGVLPVVKIRGSVRVDREALDRWLDQQREGGSDV